MLGILLYLFMFFGIIVSLLIYVLSGQIPEWAIPYELPIFCSISGGVGGVLYCLRGVYLNFSVKKQWDKVWYPWYIIRPVASIITGGISFVFLKAGLLVLESQPKDESTFLGFYALAFIAGLNVDKFISKIEDLALATWGIEKSRASKNTDSASKQTT